MLSIDDATGKPVEALIQSFLLVAVSEMGDKTQLLALVLAAKFKKPWPILAGIFVATVLNHGLASWLGSFGAGFISQDILKWILAALFIGFGFWMLVPDQDEGLNENYKWGPFLTTTVAFFLAEMGDKTQLATVALSAKFVAPVIVTIGTTAGMMFSDGLAVVLGHHFTDRIPMKLVHRIAAVMFILFGIAIPFT